MILMINKDYDASVHDTDDILLDNFKLVSKECGIRVVIRTAYPYTHITLLAQKITLDEGKLNHAMRHFLYIFELKFTWVDSGFYDFKLIAE